MTGRSRLFRGATLSWLALGFLVAGGAGPARGGSPEIGSPPAAGGAGHGIDTTGVLGPDGLPLVLPLAEGVRDPVFAILIGMMENGLYGSLDGSRLRAEVHARGTSTALPVDQLQVMQRLPHPGSPEGLVRMVAYRDLDVPAPYDVVGYHPGRLRASRIVEFEEWNLGTVILEMPRQGEEERPGRIVLKDVRLWGVRRGHLEIDVDGWLDFLLGSKLDDTRITGFSLFRYQGRWVGLAMGYNPEGKGRSGSFSFLTDQVLFPSPRPYKVAAVQMRRRLEQLMPSLTAYRRPVG